MNNKSFLLWYIIGILFISIVLIIAVKESNPKKPVATQH